MYQHDSKVKDLTGRTCSIIENVVSLEQQTQLVGELAVLVLGVDSKGQVDAQGLDTVADTVAGTAAGAGREIMEMLVQEKQKLKKNLQDSSYLGRNV